MESSLDKPEELSLQSLAPSFSNTLQGQRFKWKSLLQQIQLFFYQIEEDLIVQLEEQTSSQHPTSSSSSS